MAKDFSQQANLPIGLRNNNPGNLRPSLVSWKGQNGSNGGFCFFTDLSYGLRAMATDLSNKISVDGLDTITDIITKYAPPSENDTQSYINNVARLTGWDADAVINLTTDNLVTLMRAQISVENGAQYAVLIDDSDIREGISLMSTSILSKIKDFFADSPVITAVSAGGVILAVTVLFVYLLKKYKK
jgi:hypothetical protein